MIQFVRPDTTTISLAGGERLTVRTRLNVGQVNARWLRSFSYGPDGQRRADPLAYAKATVTAYLVDWTVADETGAPILIRDLSVDDLGALLDHLDAESFTVIRQAIDDHEARMAAARELEKKTTKAGTNGSPDNSPSLVAAGGPTATSTH